MLKRFFPSIITALQKKKKKKRKEKKKKEKESILRKALRKWCYLEPVMHQLRRIENIPIYK